MKTLKLHGAKTQATMANTSALYRSYGTQRRSRIRSCSCPPPLTNSTNNSTFCSNNGHPRSFLSTGNISHPVQIENAPCPIHRECADLDESWTSWGTWSDCACSVSYSFRKRLRVKPRNRGCPKQNVQIRPCRYVLLWLLFTKDQYLSIKDFKSSVGKPNKSKTRKTFDFLSGQKVVEV